MKKSRFLIVLVCALLLVGLTGCNAHTLLAAGTVHEMCQLNLSDGDYLSLCSRDLPRVNVELFSSGILDAGGQYVVIPDGSAIYRTLEGSAPVLDEDENCVGIYAGTDRMRICAQGYAMVSFDPASSEYLITELTIQPVG